jgi:hypothetical protein
MAYAARTSVPVAKSKADIEALVERHGATQYVSGWADDRVALGFTIEGRQVRIELPMPEPGGYTQTQYDQEIRRRWRSLLAVLKAKLIAVEDGISTIEREFLADIVLPNGTTVSDWARDQIESVYQNGAMPALLPGSRTMTAPTPDLLAFVDEVAPDLAPWQRKMLLDMEQHIRDGRRFVLISPPRYGMHQVDRVMQQWLELAGPDA